MADFTFLGIKAERTHKYERESWSQAKVGNTYSFVAVLPTVYTTVIKLSIAVSVQIFFV